MKAYNIFALLQWLLFVDFSTLVQKTEKTNEKNMRAKQEIDVNYLTTKQLPHYSSICLACLDKKKRWQWFLLTLLSVDCQRCFLAKVKTFYAEIFLKSIAERSIDLMATPNWLCSNHSTERLISIQHLTAISQHSKKQSRPTEIQLMAEVFLNYKTPQLSAAFTGCTIFSTKQQLKCFISLLPPCFWWFFH